MADIAASDVTVTVVRRSIEGKSRRNRVTIAFGDNTLTYPAGGVPMPAADKFGLKRNLEFLNIYDQDDSVGHFWKYDATNNKLRCYVQGVVVGAAGSQTLDDFPITAGDGVTADTHLSLKAGSATVRFGVLQEMATGDTPVAQAMAAEAVGW